MKLPPLPLLDGDTFLIDNSRLENYTRCKTAGRYAILHKRTSSYEKAALNFGRAVHTAMEVRYTCCGSRQVDAITQAKQLVLLDEWWQVEPTPFDDYRSLGLAQDSIRGYNRNYGEEPFQLLKKPDGKFLVEEPFAVKLGTIDFEFSTSPIRTTRPIKVIWTGRIDLPVLVSDEIWMMDHKTASRANDMREFQTSSALKGYCYAYWKRFGILPTGGIINQIVCKRPTKTKVTDPNVFDRQSFRYTEEIMEEWREHTLAIVSDFFRDYARGLFPMETKNCRGVYGLCEFHTVCCLSPSIREETLYGDEYKDDTWSPMREGPINPQTFAAMPDNDPRLVPYLTDTPKPGRAVGSTSMPDYTELL